MAIGVYRKRPLSHKKRQLSVALYPYVSGITGTATMTFSAATIAAAGTTVPPAFTGTAAMTFSAVTIAAAGTYTAPDNVDELVATDFAFSSLVLETVAISQEHKLSTGDFAFSPLSLGGTLITEEGYMSVTQASNGGVYRLTAASDVITGDLVVKRMRWVGATTAGHSLEVRTAAAGADDVVWASLASTTNFNDQIDFGSEPMRLNGLTVQTMSSGVLYVYIK